MTAERRLYLADDHGRQRLAPEFADVLCKERIIFECSECSRDDGHTIHHTFVSWDERCALKGLQPIPAALDRARELLSGGAA